MIEVNKYVTYETEEMILRDHLATDRTALANERTFLAYIRTSLSITVAGASFIKFTDVTLINMIGYLFVPLGLIIGILGVRRYLYIRMRLQCIVEKKP